MKKIITAIVEGNIPSPNHSHPQIRCRKPHQLAKQGGNLDESGGHSSDNKDSANDFKLAKFMHDEYERISREVGWNTQDKCKVEFDDLPKENKEINQWFKCGRRDYKTKEILLCESCKGSDNQNKGCGVFTYIDGVPTNHDYTKCGSYDKYYNQIILCDSCKKKEKVGKCLKRNKELNNK